MIILCIEKWKQFCHYCLQAVSTKDILKHHIKDCFKINAKQRLILPKKGEHIKFRNHKRKTSSPFIIYADFESVLVPEKNEKQIQKNLILANIKNILLAPVAIN